MKQSPKTTASHVVSTTMLRYTNSVYGVSFDYPDRYDASVKEFDGESGAKNLMILLVNKGTVIPANAEGPTAISLSIFPNSYNATKKNALENWIRTSPYSNFKTSRFASPLPTTIANKDARTYTWDGLYPGLSIVTTHGKNIYMFSVTSNGPSDGMKKDDYNALLQTVRFLELPSGVSGN